jgi:hypothetical protein
MGEVAGTSIRETLKRLPIGFMIFRTEGSTLMFYLS